MLLKKSAQYTEIVPGKKRVKTFVTKLSFYLFGMALQTAYRIDPLAKAEFDTWPETFCFVIKVEPRGPFMVIQKRSNTVQYMGEKEIFTADLMLHIKNIEFAFLNMVGFLSIPRAVFENRQFLTGDLGIAMSAIRCMERAVILMMPNFLAGRFIKEVPRLTFKTIVNRVLFYTVGCHGFFK